MDALTKGTTVLSQVGGIMVIRIEPRAFMIFGTQILGLSSLSDSLGSDIYLQLLYTLALSLEIRIDGNLVHNIQVNRGRDNKVLSYFESS